jgi:hypothetical protein
MVCDPQGVLDVWQTKDLREGVFGSVAMIRLSVGLRGCVANKGVTESGKGKIEIGKETRI